MVVLVVFAMVGYTWPAGSRTGLSNELKTAIQQVPTEGSICVSSAFENYLVTHHKNSDAPCSQRKKFIKRPLGVTFPFYDK